MYKAVLIYNIDAMAVTKRAHWTISLPNEDSPAWKFMQTEENCVEVGDSVYHQTTSWSRGFVNLVINEKTEKCSLSQCVGWQRLVELRNEAQAQQLAQTLSQSVESQFLGIARAPALPKKKARSSFRDPVVIDLELPANNEFVGGTVKTLAPQTALDPFGLRLAHEDVVSVVEFIRSYGVDDAKTPREWGRRAPEDTSKTLHKQYYGKRKSPTKLENDSPLRPHETGDVACGFE